MIILTILLITARDYGLLFEECLKLAYWGMVHLTSFLS